MADVFLIPYVRAVWQMLAHRLGPGGRLCIYGGGKHTRWLLSVTKDLPCLPIECIIDDQPASDGIGDVPVRPPGAVDIEAIDVILVSTDRWEDQLVARIRELWGDRVDVVRLYENLPPGPYDKTDDRSEATARVQARAASNGWGRTSDSIDAQDADTVVIVTDQPRSREAKLACALRDAGARPVLLHHRSPTFDTTTHFEQARSFRNEWEALRIACDHAPVAYHVMVNTDYRLAERFLRQKPGVVVVDSYDLVNGMYTDAFFAARPAYAAEIDRERFCLEHADGLVCRSLEIDAIKKQFGYACPSCLMVSDGCWNQVCDASDHPAGGSLHIAYAGKVVPHKAGCDPFSAEGQRLPLAKTLAGHGIHLHLYPSFEDSAAAFEEAFSEYHDFEQSSAYFHLHRPVPADRMVDELAQHDASILIYNHYAFPGSASLPWSDTKLRLATTNKFFDYIDAGLPLVHNAAAGSWVADTTAKYGVGVNLHGHLPAAWGNRLREQDWSSLRANARRAREACDVRHHAHALIDFYRSLHRDYPTDGAKAASVASRNNMETHEHADHRSDGRPVIVR